MATGTHAGLPEPGGLQFDRAEFDQAAPAAVACAACKRPIEGDYYEINGTVVCEPCRDAIEGQLRDGSGFARFLMAGGLGLGGAVVGAAGYAAVRWFSHYELWLISILVGYLVGTMVRRGSGGRGGLTYQFLAVGLTYVAVALTYMFLAVAEIQSGAPFGPPGEPFPWALIVVFSFIFPVVAAKQSPISIAILGFALWQAWKLNQKRKLVVTGPYRVGDGTREGPVEGAPSHA